MSSTSFTWGKKPWLIRDSNPGPLGFKSAMLPTEPLRSLSKFQISPKNKSDGNFARDKTANSKFWNFISEEYPTHPYKFRLRNVKPWVLFKKNRCRTNLMHFPLSICGKFTRALLVHQIFFWQNNCLMFVHNFHSIVPKINYFAFLDSKKSDALVGRVTTFIKLHTKEFKIAFKIRNL
jgi:hypothetical protein